MYQNDHPAPDREALLMRMMQAHGDAVLRSCYLLCGDLIRARLYAQRVFILAYFDLTDDACAGPFILRHLLRIAMRICPCPFLPCRFRLQHLPVSRILNLPPSLRQIAVLCAYHSFSCEDAAQVLGITEKLAQRRWAIAQRRLSW